MLAPPQIALEMDAERFHHRRERNHSLSHSYRRVQEEAILSRPSYNACNVPIDVPDPLHEVLVGNVEVQLRGKVDERREALNIRRSTGMSDGTHMDTKEEGRPSGRMVIEDLEEEEEVRKSGGEEGVCACAVRKKEFKTEGVRLGGSNRGRFGVGVMLNRLRSRQSVDGQ
ncbi:hypothetical protein KPH14_012875 [Odynerus spinipes]|uniref:Uncharacterized protein n=1 Tax=Odynerus spinipes TaxID=1348599 RepID=A0AAD9R9A7_9HYME|nr:hypothetical protein KPH14_012875 [Odynerus spinipes]